MAFRFGDFAATSQSLTTKGHRHILVGGLEHVLFFHSVGNFHPSQLTNSIIFQRVGIPPTSIEILYLMKFGHWGSTGGSIQPWSFLKLQTLLPDHGFRGSLAKSRHPRWRLRYPVKEELFFLPENYSIFFENVSLQFMSGRDLFDSLSFRYRWNYHNHPSTGRRLFSSSNSAHSRQKLLTETHGIALVARMSQQTK